MGRTYYYHGRNDNPCDGCTDRYPACSGHCTKPAFLKWRAEQELIRQNRAKYTPPIWATDVPYDKRGK